MSKKRTDKQDRLSARMAETLRDHEEPYQAGAWERFEAGYPGLQDLSPVPAAPIAAPARRRLYWPAVAAVLLLGVFSWWLIDWQEDPALSQDPAHLQKSPGPALVQGSPEGLRESPPMVPESPVMVQESASGLKDSDDRNGDTRKMRDYKGDARKEDPSEAATLVAAFTGDRPGKRDPQETGIQVIRKPLPVLAAVAGAIPGAAGPLDPGRHGYPGHSGSAAYTGPDPALTPQILPGRSVTRPTEINPYERLAAAAETGPAPLVAGTQQHQARPHLDKWDIGIALASALTSERLNFGTGILVAYHLSERISIGSGIGISRMGLNEGGIRFGLGKREEGPAGPIGSTGANGTSGATCPTGSYNSSSPHVPNPGGATSPNAGAPAVPKDGQAVYYSRQFQKTTSDVLVMDIPFDLTFSVSERFYAATGLSLVHILQETRTNRYLERTDTYVYSNQQTVQHSSESRFIDIDRGIQPLQDFGSLGFLNISIGHRRALTKKIKLSIEPFAKIPVGRRFSQDRMNLTNGGIRIITGF